MRSLLFVLLLAVVTASRPNARGHAFETLFADNQGRSPWGKLVKGSDGNFYGTTQAGGASGYGTVFKVTPTGTFTTLVSFNRANGSNPSAGLIEGSDGYFYGTTSGGGANGYGTVFKMTSSGELITLVSFNRTNGSSPSAALVEGNDGNFYGTTYYGGANGYGTVFKVTPSGALTTLVSFNITNGRYPSAALVQGSDGNFYGTASGGGSGTSGFGTVFKVTPAGECTVLISFVGSNGSNPVAGLVEGTDGNFYGTTEDRGANGYGTAFKITPAGILTTLVSFGYSTGGRPLGELVQGADGNFYGTASAGASGVTYGTVFKVTPSGVYTPLASFNWNNGSKPRAGLAVDSDGSFYGTTESGGGSGNGTIFKVTPTGTFSTLVSLNSTNGTYPRARLLKGSDESFYGTTELGGASGSGTIFKVASTGTFATLASFNATNGSSPSAGLIEGTDGNFYGTTEFGSPSGYGTVFKMTRSGALVPLVLFNGANGSRPAGKLLEGNDGNFYGTTFGGGASLDGTIFRMTPAGDLTTLVSFNSTNGSKPSAGLVRGTDGNFYGTTYAGGASNLGTIFKVTPAGVLTTLVSFNSTNGHSPAAGLVEGSDGSFYGTTTGGGVNNFGTVFKVNPDGVLTTLVSFAGSNGSFPRAGLVEGVDGNFYGTSESGGASDYGTIFRITPEGVLTTLHSFDGIVAARPEGAPVFGSDGKLYGIAAQLVVWRLSLSKAPTVTAAAPSAITATDAAVISTINANGADTNVTFEYGLTPNYGSSIVATPTMVTGSDATAVSATLSGLVPHTTYYYRLTASNSEGTTSTTGTFATSNRAPIASGDSVAADPLNVGAFTFTVLENDIDPDGDSLTIIGVVQGSFGTVSTDGVRLNYTPGPGFVGRDRIGYWVSDGIDSRFASVDVRADVLFTRVFSSTGSAVPGAGQEGSEVPAGMLFRSFGVPSINSAGTIASLANYTSSTMESDVVVLAVTAQASWSKIAARRGQFAPGTNGAQFSSFKDPLLSEAGRVAFLATLSGGDATRASKEGIWISPFFEEGSVGTKMVARTGTQPSGVADGARWKSFTSVSFANDKFGADWALAFTGFMVTGPNGTKGPGGVKSSNDMGLWIATHKGTVLALREGQQFQIGETEKTLRSFGALMTLSNAPGQGNGLTNLGGVVVQAFFTDGSQAVLGVSGPGGNDSVTIKALALSGDPVADIGETSAKFGIPVQSSSGATTAWLGSLSGKGNPAAIFERNLSEPGLLQLLARKGDAVPGIDGASFSAFRSVAVNDTGDALFLGKVSGRGISGSSNEGLWWKQGSGDNASLQLLAREGTQPPGVPEGARWSSFTSLALSEVPYGPLFTAKLVAGGKGLGKITSANDQGLWAVDSQGKLQLIAREGQEVSVEGSSTPKTLKSFTVLNAVPGSPAQRRSIADDGQIVYRALFTDGSQAVIKVQLP